MEVQLVLVADVGVEPRQWPATLGLDEEVLALALDDEVQYSSRASLSLRRLFMCDPVLIAHLDIHTPSALGGEPPSSNQQAPVSFPSRCYPQAQAQHVPITAVPVPGLHPPLQSLMEWPSAAAPNAGSDRLLLPPPDLRGGWQRCCTHSQSWAWLTCIE